MMGEQMQETVALGDAKSVRALMQMGTGRLAIKGGAETLMSGRFDFPTPEWRPEVTYDVSEGYGNLAVKQPVDLASIGREHGTHSWDVAFGNQAPLELAVRLGAGDADLHLGDTRAVLLEAAVGSGQIQADLSGAADLRNVSVKSGSGRVGMIFAGEYANLANVEVSVASGATDLALDGSYPALKHLKLNTASGRIGLRLSGTYADLKAIVLNTASGVVDLDLSGTLPEELEVGIHCVSGIAKVSVPAGLAVAVRFSSVSGKVKAPDFRKQNGLYVNDAYQEGAAVLHLKMSTVSGELVLQLGKS